MKFNLFLIFLFFFIYPNISYSQSFYLLGGAGITNGKISQIDKNTIDTKIKNIGFESSKTTSSNENFSYKLGMGINIPLLFSLEGYYGNFGKITINSTTTTPSENINSVIKLNGLNLDILKNLGPAGISLGVLKIDEKIKIKSSKGNVGIPVDTLFFPKIGANLKYKNYRLDFNRIYLSPDSQANSVILTYMFTIF